MEYTARHFQAFSALQAEVRAIWLAIQAIKGANLRQAIIVTDCKQVSDAISRKEPPLHLDWRLYSELYQVCLFVKDNVGIKCVFRGRQLNSEAHQLTNWVRIRKLDLSGTTNPFF
jgi:ribonuclease HI